MAAVCNNWLLLLDECENLIGSYYQDEEGETYRFFGLVHGDDDYYYGMSSLETGKVRLLSCVSDIEGFGFTEIEE